MDKSEDQNQNEELEKYSYLKAKYIFRFPFTITSIKWGFSLGFFFGIHTYIKKKSLKNSIYWFFAGSALTGFPIWGFFMLKYCFYSVSLRKFEEEQHLLLQENNLIKDYLTKKTQINVDIDDDEILAKKISKFSKALVEKHSQLDDLLTEGHMQDIENMLNK